ncbi:MAG: ferritin-like domain-containing protein [Planctomycetota bacterium]
MNKKVIDALNAGRSRELSAIIQYLAFHYEMDDQQYGKLAKTWKETGIAEMKHAEALAERILFLGGEPTTKPDAPAQKGLKIDAQLALGEKLEADAVQMYNDAVKLCAAEGDQGTKDVFEKLLEDEEAHLDSFQNILAHVKDLGPAYLATLTGE